MINVHHKFTVHLKKALSITYLACEICYMGFCIFPALSKVGKGGKIGELRDLFKAVKG